MNWNCPVCNEELGEYNAYCEYCKVNDNVIIYNPNKYFIRDVCIDSICSEQGGTKMTPQEELFAELFNGYKHKPTVNAMTDLELRAHREELSKIAFEAKAYIYAVDDILKERKPKGPQGFAKSLNIDDASTNAINIIKEKQKKLTRLEKIQAGLEKLGITSTDASKLLTAGTILGRIKQKASEIDGVKKEESKPVFNPFEKK